MMDIIVGYFSNPLTWVFMGVFVLLGVLVGIFLRPWVGNKVIKLIPADHRFHELQIDEETAISIQCKEVKGMPIQRFLKHHPGFTGIVGRILKKPISLFLGLEGTAYTWKVEEGKERFLGGLSKAVRSIWGEDFWATVPERQKYLLDESRIQVTVGLDEAPITPKGQRSISEEDVYAEEDRRASKTFWEEHRSAQRGYLINLLLAGGTGFGIALALQIIGILDISPATQPAVQEAANQTAHIIGALWHGIITRIGII